MQIHEEVVAVAFQKAARMGSSQDFEGVQGFVRSANSALQLVSHHLSQQQGILSFNVNGGSVVLVAAIQRQWKPRA
jgi:hypothetical protein